MKNRIKELRIKKNLSISDLAKLVEVNEEELFYYENDEVTMNIENVIRIADYFNVTLDYMFGREAKKPEIENIYMLQNKSSKEFIGDGLETYEEALMELSKNNDAEITISYGRWWPEIEATVLIDEFILAATSLVFPGEINPRDVISRLQQGEDFSDISYDYGMTDASLMEEIERARKYYAPYADYWDNHRDMQFEEVSENDIDPDEIEEANENEPLDDESEDDDVPF